MDLLDGLDLNVISMDIGAYEIKLVVGRVSKNGIVIDNYFTIKTPEGSYSDGNIINKNLLKNEIGKKLKEENIKVKSAYLTINSGSIITREVVIPKVEENEIKNLISFQIEDYLPKKPEEYIVQWEKIDLVYEDDIEKYRLLLIAIPKEVVQSHFELLKELNLIPLVLDYQSNSLSKLIKHNEFINNCYPTKDLTFAAIDIGHDSTKVSIVKDGIIQVSRSIDIGGRSIERGIIKDFLKNLHNEIEMIFKYYLTRDSDNSINMILLVGGLTSIEELSSEFLNCFHIPSIKVESFSDIEFNIKIHKYINSIGSLIREKNMGTNDLNFFKSYIKKDRSIIKKQVIVVTTTILLLGFFLFGFILNKVKIKQIQKDIKEFKVIVEDGKTNKKINEINEKEKYLEEFRRNLEKTNSLDKKIEKGRIIDDDFLNSIISKMPSGVSYTSLDISRDVIEIIGTAKNKASVAVFTEELKGIEVFKEIFISNISPVDKNCDFILNIALKDVCIDEEVKSFEQDEDFDEFYEEEEFDEE